MTDRYEKIRKALAKGPMQGPWGATLRDLLAERDAQAAEIEALRAERGALREALEDIRSRMRLDPFDRLAELDNIHQIADAALSKESIND